MRFHVDPKRLWHYINSQAELTEDEHAHAYKCEYCLQLFAACVLAESPDRIRTDEIQQTSA